MSKNGNNLAETVVEKRSYDAWGRLRKPTTLQPYGSGEQPTLFLNRGYTGHEHLPEFGLINMNARLYDPVIGRFLSPDPYVADGTFSQDFNRYTYARNNPLIYTDPTGEFFFADVGIGIFLNAACWGAAIGAATYTASVGFSDGGFNNWNWGNFGKSVGIGALSGVVTAGIGQMFGAVGSMGFGGEIARAYTHGFAQGMISEFTGGSFMQGFAAGGLGSLAGSAFMMTQFGNSQLGTYAFSGLSGGVGAAMTGGDFWQGAGIGLMTAGLNHLQSAVDAAGARHYANKKAGYKDMWKNSFADGVAVREVSAWEIDGEGLIMLPFDKNGLRDSRNNALSLKMDSQGVREVEFNGKWYKVSGHAHTHPEIDPTGYKWMRTGDIPMFNQLNGNRVHNKIPLTILYDKQIYHSIYNSRTKLWNSTLQGTW